MSDMMEDTTTDVVGTKLREAIQEIKNIGFDAPDGTTLIRIGGFLDALNPLYTSWVSGQNVSGKVPGKRGRKPGQKNAKTLAREAAERAAGMPEPSTGPDVEAEEEEDEAASEVVTAGADAPLTETQFEEDAPPTARSRAYNE